MEKIRKDRQHDPVLYSLNESLQTFTGYESFFELQPNLKNKVFQYFFLRFSISSSVKRSEPYHYYFLSFSSFSFSAVRPDHLPESDLQIKP